MTETLNTKVLEEMENLENRYRQSEQELRHASQNVRRQLQDAQKGEREALNSLKTLQQKVGMSETEEYACMKRIEGQMRVIFKEFKSAQHRMTSGSRSAPDSA